MECHGPRIGVLPASVEEGEEGGRRREEERGGSRVTRYLTQEGLQVIPVQNWLMTCRIVTCLDPRKIGGQPNFHTSAGVITAEAGLPTEGAGLGAVAMPGQRVLCTSPGGALGTEF